MGKPGPRQKQLSESPLSGQPNVFQLLRMVSSLQSSGNAPLQEPASLPNGAQLADTNQGPAAFLQNLLKNSNNSLQPPAPSPANLASLLAEGANPDPESLQRIATAIANNMKVPPIALPGTSGAGPPIPFSQDLLWRFPNPFIPQPPPSPLESGLRSHLPPGLGHDPKSWSRDDVAVFLRSCEKEFDLERIDMDKFQMNGKALCYLTKNDLSERCSGAGDVIHNILQGMVREASSLFPPSSPLTPRAPGLITPTSPAFPHSPHGWPPFTNGVGIAAAAAGADRDRGDDSAAAAAAAAAIAGRPAADKFPPNLSHLVSQTNSVTLSPAPSVESQNGSSPKHTDAAAAAAVISSIHQLYPQPRNSLPSSQAGGGQGRQQQQQQLRSHSASSTHSDDSSEDQAPVSPTTSSSGARSRTPMLQGGSGPTPRSPCPTKDCTPSSSSPNGKDDAPELNTNGRLLWDFLQQLLNDPQQRYSQYIAWKDQQNGVFKIVDPPGLAKLWGIQKNHLSMNYDKMSRALRYYYRVNILRKVQGERHCYQFLKNTSELKSIKNISLLRQQIEAQAAAQKLPTAQQVAQAAAAAALAAGHPAVEAESASPLVGVEGDSDEPTDLSVDTEEKKALRNRERVEREQRYIFEHMANSSRMRLRGLEGNAVAEDRDREELEARPSFDLRHLMNKASDKTDNL